MVKVPAVISQGEVIDPDLLWYIHGKAYDLSKFMYTHPGQCLQQQIRSLVHMRRNCRVVSPDVSCRLFPSFSGGSEALATCRGRDITSLFESYHAFNVRLETGRYGLLPCATARAAREM